MRKTQHQQNWPTLALFVTLGAFLAVPSDVVDAQEFKDLKDEIILVNGSKISGTILGAIPIPLCWRPINDGAISTKAVAI
ncbi:MAG: hypothetical protein P1V97_35350, partial [Planctomycetota bacterium]|nr:hypothetical protein [Planctomycetota bacterium]